VAVQRVVGSYRGLRGSEGNIKNFTSLEAPENPNIEIKTVKLSVEESAQKALDYILPIFEYKNL